MNLLFCLFAPPISLLTMKSIPEDSPLAVDVTKAIKEGETNRLQQLLTSHQGLATARVAPSEGPGRTLLHLATDWPGHFPNVGETIAILVRAGAEVDAGISGPNSETALHWAASSNDVVAVEALLDADANMDAKGAVIAGGDPLEDAIGFQNWDAARALVKRGAKTAMGDEAALGLLDKVKARFEKDELPGAGNINYSFWNACCAGQISVARFLVAKGADIYWTPDWCDEGPLDGALKSDNQELISWLKDQGATENSKPT